MAFTRRAIWDSEHPHTASSTGRPDRVQRPHGGGSDGHHRALGLRVGLRADYRDAVGVVILALDVAPGQCGRLAAPEAGVGQYRHQGHVKLPPFRSLLGRLEAAAAPARQDGGEADDGENVGGEGAGLALGLREAPAQFIQRGGCLP